MIKIELAHVEGANVFILAWLPYQASVEVVVTLAIDGSTVDLSGNVRRFPRREPAAPDHLPLGLLVAKPLSEETFGGPLVGRDGLLSVSNPTGNPFQVEIHLRHEPAAFRRTITEYDRVFRGLLEQAGREEAYLLETDIWPEAAEREEAADLVELSPGGRLDVDFCCVPIPGVLVVGGFLLDPSSAVTAIDIFHGDEDVPFNRRLIRFERPLLTPDPRDLRIGSGFAIVVEFSEAAVPTDNFVLLLASKTRVWTKTLRPRARLDRGLDVLAVHLTALDADTRLLVVEELAAVASRRRDAPALFHLLSLQVAAIEDLPAALSRPALGLRLTVDLAATINEHGVFLLGWASLEPEFVRAVEFLAPGPSGIVRWDVSSHWVLHRRMDVWRALKDEGELIFSDQLGYICVARTPGLATPTTAYLAVHMVDDSVRRMKLKLRFASLDPIDAIKPLLTAFAQTHLRLRELLDRHIGPAVTALWAQRRLSGRMPEVTLYGPKLDAPECSLIIPLYGRYDFMEHQIARFADDPALAGQELIYVVDDPAIYDDVRLLASELFLLYEMPFRIVYAGRNLGFAGAVNLGVAQARGRYLLLMNSDVLPRRFTWLDDLIAAYRRLPDAGAISPKLLYEDNSIQHAGMRSVRYPLWGNMWINEHPGKGLPDDFGAEPLECDTITGACMLIDADLYRRVGGFSEDYIIGDFEDSDLCFKLVQAGRRNWVVMDVELYHLERQSQSLVGQTDWRTNLTLLNCWTHFQRWDALISSRAVAR